MSELPDIKMPYPHVEARPDLLSGSPVVRGTRVPIRRLWMWHRKGVVVETLIKRYPQLGPAKVLSALAFAYDNQEVIQADIDREQKMLDEDRIPVDPRQVPLPFGEKKDGVQHIGTDPQRRSGVAEGGHNIQQAAVLGDPPTRGSSK